MTKKQISVQRKQEKRERQRSLSNKTNGMMEAGAAGTNCQGIAGGNKSRHPTANPTKKMTKKQRRLQRKQEKLEREGSLLNKSLAMLQHVEQGGQPREAAEIRRDLSKARGQVKNALKALRKFRREKATEERELVKSVTTAEATIRALRRENQKSLDIVTEQRMNSEIKASARMPEPEPQAAGNEQRSSVNIKEEPGTQASKTSDLPDSSTFQAHASSGNQGLPVQRVSPQHECPASRNWPPAENGFQPFVPKCETCRSILCCDERIMLHKRLQCSSQAHHE